MTTNRLNILKFSLMFLAGLALGAAGVFVYTSSLATPDNTKKNQDSEVHTGLSGFVNPLVDCNQWTEKLPPKANLLKDKLEAYIKESKKNNHTEQISVFYRDLLNGPQIEIESEETFAAASLLKVPILIYYMKLAETNPDELKKKIKYIEKDSVITYAIQTITPPPPLVDGQEYAVDDLISRMIGFSDNHAAELLLKNRPELNVTQLLMNMGIILYTVNNDYWISVRSYASIFRILYNATYLTDKMSNASLQLLSLSSFKLGLRSSVPSHVTVSSKFGERNYENKSQLHDCGIIYHPERPYILCIMTKGNDKEKLITSIHDLSKIVWNTVDLSGL